MWIHFFLFGPSLLVVYRLRHRVSSRVDFKHSSGSFQFVVVRQKRQGHVDYFVLMNMKPCNLLCGDSLDPFFFTSCFAPKIMDIKLESQFSRKQLWPSWNNQWQQTTTRERTGGFLSHAALIWQIILGWFLR